MKGTFLLENEVPIQQFTAEVIEQNNLASRYLQADLEATNVNFQDPKKSFTSLIIETNLRLIFLEVTENDIITALQNEKMPPIIAIQAVYLKHIKDCSAIGGCIDLAFIFPFTMMINISNERSADKLIARIKEKENESENFKAERAVCTVKTGEDESDSSSSEQSVRHEALKGYFDCYEELCPDRNPDIIGKVEIEVGKQPQKIASIFDLSFISEPKKSTPVALSLENIDYSACNSYSALFATPNPSLSKPELFENRRFPIIAFGRIMSCGSILSNGKAQYEEVLAQTVVKMKKDGLKIFDLGECGFDKFPLQTVSFDYDKFVLSYDAAGEILCNHEIPPVIIENNEIAASLTAYEQNMLRSENVQVLIEKAGYYNYLKQLMADARTLIIEQAKNQLVLVTGKYEQSYGHILICLCEILINPLARTPQGFLDVIKRHLEMTGFHDFKLLVLLIDAVNSLVAIHSECFVYGSNFLTNYLFEISSGKYSNFAYANEFSRVESGIIEFSRISVGQKEGKVSSIDVDTLPSSVKLSGFWRMYK